jgi:cytoskeletal protein CcmA (bactofilin family)
MADTMSVLSESTSLRGRVAGEGDLEIRGRVEGEIELGGELVIAETAAIQATLRATRVVIHGAVVGDIGATESISLGESARVVGNLVAPRISIALGAQIRGDLDMGLPGAVKPRAAARPAAAPARAPAAAARPAPARVAAPPAAPPRRAPMPPARAPMPLPLPRPQPVLMHVASTAPIADEASGESGDDVRREPPSPVVPAIKKGARAASTKKRG